MTARRMTLGNVKQAETWLLAQLALPRTNEAYKRLRLTLDTLKRYQWTAEEFVKWWAEQAAIDAPPE
jgi:hypothetical protein